MTNPTEPIIRKSDLGLVPDGASDATLQLEEGASELVAEASLVIPVPLTPDSWRGGLYLINMLH